MKLSDREKDKKITEKFIKKVLKNLSKQRVIFLRTDNVWIIENVIEHCENVTVALLTCYMRGWIEPIERAIQKGNLTEDGKLPPNYQFTHSGPIYRLTDSGWNKINNSHGWVLKTFSVALITLIITFITLVVTIIGGDLYKMMIKVLS